MNPAPFYQISTNPNDKDYYDDFVNQETAINRLRDKFESAKKHFTDKDFIAYRPHIADAYFPYIVASKDEKNNYEISLFAVAQNAHNISYVPDSLKINAFIGLAFKLNPEIIKYLPDNKKNNGEFIENICLHRPELFQHFSEAQKNDPKFCTVAMRYNPSLFSELPESMRNTKQVVEVATIKEINGNESIKDSVFEFNKTLLSKEYLEQLRNTKQEQQPQLEFTLSRTVRKK